MKHVTFFQKPWNTAFSLNDKNSVFNVTVDRGTKTLKNITWGVYMLQTYLRGFYPNETYLRVFYVKIPYLFDLENLLVFKLWETYKWNSISFFFCWANQTQNMFFPNLLSPKRLLTPTFTTSSHSSHDLSFNASPITSIEWILDYIYIYIYKCKSQSVKIHMFGLEPKSKKTLFLLTIFE